MNRWIALTAALVWLPGGLVGCVSPTDPLGRQDALEETQRRYTELVRWGELEKASTFVDPELQADFMALEQDYDALRITDFEISEIVYEEEGASVTVSYEGYLMTTLIERSAREEQQWYREEGLGNVWRVRPQLDAVLAALRGSPLEHAER